jgi:hypothetical protein
MNKCEKLERIFKIISFFDDFRWAEGKPIIKFFNENIDADCKILTHWLCYVMNRQISFEIIWDVGGLVISEIVCKIRAEKNIGVLRNFLQQDEERNSEGNKKYYYLQSEKDPKVKFKPRYLPSDYISILKTFLILKDFNFSLAEYISHIYGKNKDKNDIIIRILYSLHLLTYDSIGNRKGEDIEDDKKIVDELEKKKERVIEIINDEQKFEEELAKFKKEKIFKQKRAWCALRDYIKSKEFQKHFEEAMSKYISNEDILLLRKEECLKQFVLPGDVWNNNVKFRRCVLKSTSYEDSENDINVIIDKYFKEFKPEVGYPEQFDVTFDFAPRMCEKDNCDICPIKKDSSFKKICVNDRSKYCTVALFACNYKSECVGSEKCKLS